MAIIPDIENVKDRYDAVKTALESALPSRVHCDFHQHFDAYTADELQKGVITLLSDGEGDYSNRLGRMAKGGTQRLVLVGQIKVLETDTPEAIRNAEFLLMQEFKTFVDTGVPGMGLLLGNVQQSLEKDHPYGWVVATLEAGPTASTLA